ncbi:MAG: DUF1801 domain-containing protein [Bacteroidota bacterium]
MKQEYSTIPSYNRAQSKSDKAVFDLLKKEIDRAMPKAESRIWHGSPVWFLDGNPIVGYHKLKEHVRILFWSGQTFDEEGLISEGTFKAAEARFSSVDDIRVTHLRRWLSKSKKIQWDYKNIVRRKGVLERLK